MCISPFLLWALKPGSAEIDARDLPANILVKHLGPTYEPGALHNAVKRFEPLPSIEDLPRSRPQYKMEEERGELCSAVGQIEKKLDFISNE